MNEYDANRLDAEKSGISNQVVTGIASVLNAAANRMDSPPEKLLLCAGASIPSLSVIGVMLTQYEKDEKPDVNYDLVALGACYVLSCFEDHPQGMIAGYAIEMLEKTFELYKRLTGRDYPNPNKSVMEAINVHKAKVAAMSREVPVHLSKFMPN